MKNEMWTPEQPLKKLERKIASYFSEQADFLYQELRNNQLKVILIPAPEQKHFEHKIRAVESQNPEWYRVLYQQYLHFRRDRSLDSLQRIGRKRDYSASYSSYDFRYRTLILEQLVEGYELQGTFIPENEKVKGYFA